MRQIKLTFCKDGTITKEVDGFVGAGCLEATDFIDKAIGVAVKTDMKQEFYAPETVGTDQQAYLSV